MKDLEWFPPIPEARAGLTKAMGLPIVAGAGLGLLLLGHSHRSWALLVCISTLLLVLGLILPVTRAPTRRALQWVGVGAGQAASWVLLWPFYLLVFGGSRVFLSIARVDLLALRWRPELSTYWQTAAPEDKRAPYYQRLFSLETPDRKPHLLIWATGIIVLAVALAGSSELLLRCFGFGNPIVYRVDPRVGYYPAPNQDVRRYGGAIHINAFGMRSRNVTLAKPTSTFRILMLGDSTLYGGSYIDQRDLYASRLEELLNQNPRRLPGQPRRVEVLCMGVNGWGPQHELAYVQEFGLFQADLVMVMGPPADAYRPLFGLQQFPFFAEGHRPHLAWQEFWHHLSWEYQQLATVTNPALKANAQPMAAFDNGVGSWLEIATVATDQGIRVDFEFLPNKEEVQDGQANESTRRVLAALLPNLDRMRVSESYPLSLFQRKMGAARLYHDGTHLEKAGHEIYASYLRDRVLEVTSAE